MSFLILYESSSQHAKHLNHFRPLTILTKSFIIDAWLGSVLRNSSLEPTAGVRMLRKQLPLQKNLMSGVL